VGRHGLGSLDLGGGERATLGDVAGLVRAARGAVLLVLGRRVAGRALAAGLGGRLGRGLGGRLGGRLVRRLAGDIKDVQRSASGGLDGGGDTGVVGNVVTIDDVVVPVSLASLESGILESKGTLPGAGLGGRLVLGERELTDVVVPRAEKMHGLDA